jgi:hypothetical protein
MPRVIKHPELHRSKTVDWAERAFLSRSYDNSSPNEVIAEAGLSVSRIEACRSPTFSISTRSLKLGIVAISKQVSQDGIS